MDSLTHILNLARLKSSVYCRSELGSPWGLHFAARPGAVFHVLHRGKGYFQLESEAELRPIQEGDVLLLPDGQAHSIVETPGTPTLRNLELDQWGECALMRWSDTPTVVILCGTFNFEYPKTTSLLRHLPRIVHVPYRADSPINRVLELMADEAQGQRPAKEVVLRRLADILFVQIIQRWVEMHGKNSGLLGALYDPLIGKALGLIHAQPHHAWTVASLASAVGCSRSSFSAHFTALVGEPPIEYLARWRMQLASRWLAEDPSLRVGEIAARVGYSSEAAFSKAFKRLIGTAPKAYRSNARAVPTNA